MIEKEQSEKINKNTEFEKALENGPDELLNIMSLHFSKGVLPFMREAEALIEINNLEEKDRDEAYNLLTKKGKSVLEYEHSPSEVLKIFNKQED